ncbi:MAG: crossover junction endodeoxyribonuclease RuvC [Kiritimatiellia bacterium]|nr:crossover junction endodeoxyribonuclease RuvC [Lentisphaerota bacterium]
MTQPPPPAAMRVLGVDTSLRSSGAAVIEKRAGQLATLEYTVIRNPARLQVSRCLDRLQRGIAELIERWRPDVAAVEGVFYCRNAKTALALGQARGVVLAACAAAGLPVFEYAPRRVKQAVVGYGAAEKDQVRRMVMAILKLDEPPADDASDALAIAVCHMYGAGRWTGGPLMAREI